jgi:hypothetical protein
VRPKLKGLNTIDDLKAAPPHATRARRKGEGKGLMLMAPAETVKALRMRAAEEGTTVRALVLEALRNSGYSVPLDDIVDRRRR